MLLELHVLHPVNEFAFGVLLQPGGTICRIGCDVPVNEHDIVLIEIPAKSVPCRVPIQSKQCRHAVYRLTKVPCSTMQARVRKVCCRVRSV